MNIAAILKEKGTEVETIPPDTVLSDVVALLFRKRIGAVVVVEGDKVKGIVSERDIIAALEGHGQKALSLPVRDVMTHDVAHCKRADDVRAVMGLMTRRRFRHVPVMESGKLCGIVSIGDLVKRRLEDTEKEAEALRDYISSG